LEAAGVTRWRQRERATGDVAPLPLRPADYEAEEAGSAGASRRT